MKTWEPENGAGVDQYGHPLMCCICQEPMEPWQGYFYGSHMTCARAAMGHVYMSGLPLSVVRDLRAATKESRAFYYPFA